MSGYFILVIVLSLVGLIVSNQLKSKFSKYSKMPLRAGWTGAEVAAEMLRHYGIMDVRILEGRGSLTDHYNPLHKTISLSPEVYHGRSVAAAAVAAHECGHAVQHADAYAFLQMRSGLVPIVSFAARTQQFLLLAALLAFSAFPQLMVIAILSFVVTTLFSFITLPVEFDASKRALAWLDNSGITQGTEHDGAKDALHWAAMTYVVAALSSLVILVFLIFRYMGR